MTKKQKKIIAALSGFVILMGIVLGIYVAKEYEENKVSAHPTSTITLDTGGANEYTLPKDGTQLWETGLASTYDDFVQNQSKVAKLTLEHAIPQQYQTNYMYKDNQIEIENGVNKGNRLVIWNQRNDASVAAGLEPLVFQAGLALLDADGRQIKTIEFVTGIPADNNRLTTPVLPAPATGRVESTYKLLDNQNGTYTTFYAAQVYDSSAVNGVKNIAYSITVDENLTVVDRRAVTLATVSNYSLLDLTDHASAGRLYQIGAVGNGAGAVSTVTNFPLYVYHPTTDSTVLENTLKLPGWFQIASYPYADTNSGATKRIHNIIQTNDGGYLAQVVYSGADSTIPNNQSGQAIIKFTASGNFDYLIQSDVPYRSIKLMNEISSPASVYIQVQDSTQTRIICIENGSTRKEVIASNQLPADTSLTIVSNPDIVYGTEYEFYGSTSTNTGYFSLLPSGGQVIGGMDSSFVVKNVQLLANGTASFSSYNSSVLGSDRTYFVGSSGDKSFATEAPGTRTSNNSAPLGPGWLAFHANNGAFGVAGYFTKSDDFPPLVEAKEDIVVDISDSAIQAPTASGLNNWSTLDRWLITGSKNGTLADASSIKVYDTLASNDAAYGQSWLEERINRNPNDTSAAIEWSSLGFDKTKAGPQIITYFVSDNQNQVTSNSRWINKKTSETVIQADYALDAQNFAIAWGDIGTDITGINDFKKLAKTMAWDMDSHVIDENGAGGQFDSSVTVDATQLAALQAATEAKPYPVDVTYDPKGDGSLLLTNRVWVFVTTKNTEVDTTNGIVIYADDYTLPLHLAQTETMADVYTHADVKVYDYYDASHETTTPLSTLADKTTTTGLTVTNLSVITGVTGATVVQPNIQYTSGTGTTATTPDVTITAQVLMHVRQVVYSSTSGDLAELVIPSEGYLQLVNTSTRQLNLVVDSGEESTNPAFKEVYTELDDAGGNDKLDFEVIVPEYYEYKGYVVTNIAGGHSSTLLTAGTYQYDLTSGNYEQWITVYVTPKLGTDGSPKPYAWDYKLNDFGTIDAD